MDKRKEKIVEVVGIALVLVAIFGPPLLLGTATYPVAVVSGDSMYPMLKNGYIVIFSLRGVNVNDIPNGTLIAFVQTQTGLPMFASLTEHPVTHEVIARVVNQNGQVYYQTKGINNLYPDPQLIPAGNVLGVEVKVIPYLGYPLIFLSQPGGMVALIGFISVAYFTGLEKRMVLDKARRDMGAKLSMLVDQGKIDEVLFSRLMRVINYPDPSNPCETPVMEALRSASLKGSLANVDITVDDGMLVLRGRNVELREAIRRDSGGREYAKDEPLLRITSPPDEPSPAGGSVLTLRYGAPSEEELRWLRDIYGMVEYENRPILRIIRPEEMDELLRREEAELSGKGQGGDPR